MAARKPVLPHVTEPASDEMLNESPQRRLIAVMKGFVLSSRQHETSAIELCSVKPLSRSNDETETIAWVKGGGEDGGGGEGEGGGEGGGWR